MDQNSMPSFLLFSCQIQPIYIIIPTIQDFIVQVQCIDCYDQYYKELSQLFCQQNQTMMNMQSTPIRRPSIARQIVMKQDFAEGANKQAARSGDYDRFKKQTNSLKLNSEQKQEYALNGANSQGICIIRPMVEPERKHSANLGNTEFIFKCQGALAIKRCVNSKIRTIYQQSFNNLTGFDQKSFKQIKNRKIHFVKAAQNLSKTIKIILFVNQSYCKQIFFECLLKFAQNSCEDKSKKINNKIYQQYLFSKDLTRITQKDEQNEDLNDHQFSQVLKENYKVSIGQSTKDQHIGTGFSESKAPHVENKKIVKKSRVTSIRSVQLNKCLKILTSLQQGTFDFKQGKSENIPNALTPLKCLQKPLVQASDYSGNANCNFWPSKYSQSKSHDKNIFKQERSRSQSNKGLSNVSNVSTLTASTTKNEYNPTTIFGGQAVNFKNSLVKQRQAFNRNYRINQDRQLCFQPFTPIKMNPNEQQKQKPIASQKQNPKKLIIISSKSSKLNIQNKPQKLYLPIYPSLQNTQIKIDSQNNYFGQQKLPTYKINHNSYNDFPKSKYQIGSGVSQAKISLYEINKKSQSIASYFNIPSLEKPQVKKEAGNRKVKQISSDHQRFLGNARISLQNMRNNFNKQKSQSFACKVSKNGHQYQNNESTSEVMSKIMNINSLENTFINERNCGEFPISSTPKKKQRNHSFESYSANIYEKAYSGANFNNKSYNKDKLSNLNQYAVTSKKSGKKTQFWKNKLVTLRNQQVSLGEFQESIDLQKFQELDFSLQQQNNNYKFRESDKRKESARVKFQISQKQKFKIEGRGFSPELFNYQNGHLRKYTIV